MKMKCCRLFLLVLMMSMCISINAYSADYPVKINGDNYFFSKPVMNMEGSFFVSAKDLLLYQGYKVWFDPMSKKFTFIKDKIKITIENESIEKNGFVLDAKKGMKRVDNVVMLNLQLAGQLLSRQVSYDAEKNDILVKEISLEKDSWIQDTILIAHAFGAVSGKIETNSYDAFKEAYKNGFKVFETDLIFTSDNHLVARHDWTGYLSNIQKQNMPADKMDKPLSLGEFQTYKIYGTMKQITFKEIAEIMSTHKDIYLVTDTKETDTNKVKAQFEYLIKTAKAVDPSILKRIIPQFYNEEMYFTLKELYPFESYIYTLYSTTVSKDKIIEFVKKNKITVVTSPPERLSVEFIANLKKAGAVVYTHTMNTEEEFTKYSQMGVHGFYTDSLLPNNLTKKK